VKEIDALYAEKNCFEAISVSRMLLATLKTSPDESNWARLRNGGCGAFFRAAKACMNDLQTRLSSGMYIYFIFYLITTMKPRYFHDKIDVHPEWKIKQKEF
jgi:hypothetical protein